MRVGGQRRTTAMGLRWVGIRKLNAALKLSGTKNADFSISSASRLSSQTLKAALPMILPSALIPGPSCILLPSLIANSVSTAPSSLVGLTMFAYSSRKSGIKYGTKHLIPIFIFSFVACATLDLSQDRHHLVWPSTLADPDTPPKR